MTVFTPAEAQRIARLARLGLSEEEAARLAPTLEAIARDFSSLAAYADTLPPAEPAPPGEPREDVVAPADAATVDGILRAVPRLDDATRAVGAPRGAP